MFHVRRNVPLAPMTTFRIGGKADYFAEVSGALDLAEALEYAGTNKLPVYVFGGGSNILFSDRGFAGIVIRIVDGGVQVAHGRILAGAGVPLASVVTAAQEAGLAGIENLAGIPGSFGGAVRGNAGAFGTEIGERIASVKVLTRDTGMVKEYRQDACGFSYRTSVFKQDPELIIVSAELKLIPGDQETIRRAAREILRKREAKQKQDAKCAGSFFMNPAVKDETLRQEFVKDTGTQPKDDRLPAGWLIDHAGLRGKKVGGAMVSMEHPNYIVNAGNATAEDVLMLASLIKQRVRTELSVQLKEEVQLVGF